MKHDNHAPECPKHHRPLICPACAGARGGAKTSPAKAKAAAENGVKGAEVRWGKANKRKSKT